MLLDVSFLFFVVASFISFCCEVLVHCIDIPKFTPFWAFGCFQFGAFANKAGKNTCVQVFAGTDSFFSLK